MPHTGVYKRHDYLLLDTYSHCLTYATMGIIFWAASFQTSFLYKSS